MYTRAYIDAAYAINTVIDRLVHLEPTIDRNLRSEVTSTNIALTKLYDSYRGDDIDDPFASLTPFAQRAAVQGICMLRRIAQAEATNTWHWSQDESLTGEEAADYSIRSTEASGWDAYLYSLAVAANDASLKPPFTENEEEGA